MIAELFARIEDNSQQEHENEQSDVEEQLDIEERYKQLYEAEMIEKDNVIHLLHGKIAALN